MKKYLSIGLLFLGAASVNAVAGVRGDRLWQAVRNNDHRPVRAAAGSAR